MFEEWKELLDIEERLTSKGYGSVEDLAEVETKKHRYLVKGLILGSKDSKAPVFGLTAGVHGLERIGTKVVLSFLSHLLKRLSWDKPLQDLLSQLRFVTIPIVNPTGMALNQRSNISGVDLMRNSPVQADHDPPFLVGGHRFTSWLPWYRGEVPGELEPENKALLDFFEKHAFPSPRFLALDVHSGFGIRDRLWYPFAFTKKEFPFIGQVKQIRELFEESYPHHIYRIEPQSKSYTTHGDLWDHLFEAYYGKDALKVSAKDGQSRGIFIPWTLEMGSWLWIRKNPRQLTKSLGLFNPVLPHRRKRILRRHLSLLEFLMKMTCFSKSWS